MVLRILRSSNLLGGNTKLPMSHVFGGLIILLSFSAVLSSVPIPLVHAVTSTSWNTRVPCTPLIVRITDITANRTGSASFSASQFTPGITTSVSGGDAKRWLTQGPTPSGWVAPGPPCTVTNSKGTVSVFVEIDGVERDSIATEDSASSYDATNGGTSHPITYDSTFNIFDPAVVPNFSNSCTSSSDPTCYGRIHSEIDHDWKAAGYCGTGTTCDPSTLASQTSYASTKIDVQGFVYWDPGHLSAGYHNYNGWEIHPLTGWRLHQSTPDFSISASPSSVSFNTGTSSGFTTSVASQNGFTSTVTLSTSVNPPTGLTANCSPTNMPNGSGSSTCTLNSSTAGSYTVTVTGTGGSHSHSTSVSVTVTQPSSPDFAISANPNSLKIIQGSSGTSTITLTTLNGFSSTVNLSSTVSPSGPITSLNPTTVTLTSNSGGSSTLNVTASTAAAGSYTVNVTGTSSSLSHSVIVTVAVTQPPDFTISANPNSLTLGQTSSATITPVTVTTSGSRTWFESSYLADAFSAQGLIWMFFEDTSKTCEHQQGCLLYTTSPTGSSWATPINVNVHVTDSDFSVYTDGSNVYYARYNETTFQANCGRNLQFRTGALVGSSGTVNWAPEQTALKAGAAFTFQNEEIIVDSNGQAWIAFLSDSRGVCNGDGSELPQVIHSSGTNYAAWTTPETLSNAHSNNWHIALVSLGNGEIYASYWLRGSDLHGRLYNGTSWNLNLPDEQISSTTTQNDVNAWLFNSGTNIYAIYFDNTPETFSFASRSSAGTWTINTIGTGESRTGTSLSSSYYSLPDAASYDPTHNRFYLFWMNATNQRIDQWAGSGNSWTKTTKLISTAAVPYPDSITSFITYSPTNSFPTVGGIFYVSGSSPPFTYNFAALPLGPSSTGTFTVVVTGQNGFTGTVSLTTSINPSTGLSVTCSPTSFPGGTGSSTCTVNSSTSGNYNVTVTGTSGTISHSTNVYVSVAQAASPDFTISTNPNSVTVNASVSGTSTVTVAPLNGFTGTVTLALTTNSTNLVCALSSTSIIGGSGTATLSCRGSPAGNYLATAIGTSGSLTHSATVIYHVQDFAVATTPASVSVTTGAAGTSTISVSPLNGFTETVSLAATSNSTSISCSLSSTSIGGASGTSTLSCSANIPGNYLATITGSSGGLSHSATATYHVTAAPDFSISANPTSMNVNAGATGISTITVSPLNGFTGTVTLAVTTNSTNLSCNLSSTTISGGSGTSTLSCVGSAPSNYLATVNSTSARLSHLATVTYYAQDFSISANPTSVNVSLAVAGTSTITVAPLNGFAGTVALGVTTNSSNLACVLSSSGITGGSGTSTLSCNSSLPGNYLATVTGTNNSLSHTTSVTYHISVLPGFAMSADPTLVTPNVGGLGNSTITVSPVNGSTGTVLISVTTNSTSLACTVSPSAISGGSGRSILSCRGSSSGSYLANVTGTSGGISHSVAVTYAVSNPPPDFIIVIKPANITIYPGFSGVLSTVSAVGSNGLSVSGPVTLSTVNLPGLSFSFFPSTIGSSVCGCTSQLDVSAATTIPLGTYIVNITGTWGSSTRFATLTLTVASPDFVILEEFAGRAAPVSGGVDSVTTVNGVNGFYGSVTLVVTFPSNGIKCGFITATASVTTVTLNLPQGTASIDLSCSNVGPAGVYNATITGTSGSLRHTAGFTVTVTDFSISAYAVPLTVGSSSGFVTVKSILGLSGNVSLSLSIPSGLNGSCLSSLLLPSGGTTTVQCNFTSISPGVYSVNVTGSIPCSSCSIGHVSHTTTFSVTINDFLLSIAHSSVTIYPGFSGVLNAVTVSAFNGTVSLSATNLPNVSFTLSPSAITFINGNNLCGCTSEMDVSSTSSAALGTYTINVTGTVGSITHTVSMTLIIASPDFTLTLGGSSQSIPLGGSADTFVYLNGINGFYGNVNLVVASSSSAIACQFLSGNSANTPLGNNITVSLPLGSATVILSCTAVGPVGVFNATVTGTSGSLVHSAIFTVTIMDYSISATPVSFSAGSSGNSTVTVTSLHGLSGTVSLSVSTPSGLTASCPTSVNLSSGSSSSVQCKFTSTVPGTYSTNVTGTLPCINCSSSGIIVHSALSSVTVSTAKPDFILSADPGTLTIPQGSSATSSVSTTSINGFAGTISLAASVSPVGLSTSFNLGTISLTAGATRGSTLNITALGAAPGTYNVNVTATSGSLSHSLIIVVTVTSVAKPSYALVVSYEGFVYKLYPNNTLVLVGQPVKTQLSAVAWRPDGSCAIIAGNAAVLIKYDGTTLMIVPTGLGTTINLLSIAWKPDGSYALIGGSGGALLKYDCTTLTQVLNPYAVSYRAISWNPSGTQAILVSYFGQVFQYQSIGQLTKLTSGASQSFDAVAWSPDGSYALIAGDGGGILKYDGTSFQALNTVGVYSSTLTVRYVSFNPAGNLALLVGDSGLVLTYNGSTLSALPALTSSTLYSVSWSASTAYTVGGAGTMLTYSGGTPKTATTGTFSGFRGIAWKPN